MGSTNTSAKNNFAGWKLFVVSVVVCCAAMHYLHVPLPEGFGHRGFMQVAELALRLGYKYPIQALHYLGDHWQVWWARNCLIMMAAPLNHWSLDDNDVHIEDTVFNGVPVRVYVPKGERVSNGAMVFIHGGGFVLMDVPSYDGVTRELAKSLKMVVVSVEYRLAPEHPFPAGLNDCEAAVLHLMNVAYKYNVDPDQIIVSGDSAGGNLAAVVTQRLHRKRMQRNLKAQILLYPVMQFADLLTPSYQLFYNTMGDTALLDPENVARWILMYFGQKPTLELVDAVLRNNHTSAVKRLESGWVEHAHHGHLPDHFAHRDNYTPPPTTYGDPTVFSILDEYVFHPDFTPLLADDHDLSGLPPTMMVTMQYDILRDEGYWYARRLEGAGVPTLYKHYDNGFHAVLNMHSHFSLARQVMDDIVDYVHSQVH